MEERLDRITDGWRAWMFGGLVVCALLMGAARIVQSADPGGPVPLAYKVAVVLALVILIPVLFSFHQLRFGDSLVRDYLRRILKYRDSRR